MTTARRSFLGSGDRV